MKTLTADILCYLVVVPITSLVTQTVIAFVLDIPFNWWLVAFGIVGTWIAVIVLDYLFMDKGK